MGLDNKNASGNERLESVACDEGRISVTYSGSGTPLNRWRQSGKEEQVIGGNDLGVLDFGARHYDPWLARWTTQDPMAGKYTNLSPYSYCAENPVNVIDPQGDTIIVSKNGSILRNDNNDDVVMLNYNNYLLFLGRLNGSVIIDNIYFNLILDHSSESKYMNPFRLRSLVKNHGEWDLKNNNGTIWGLGNNKTTFIFNGEKMTSADIGNHHFGVVTKANIFVSERFALQKAGEAQIKAGTSLPEWQVSESKIVWHGGYRTEIKYPISPFGDDPNDQKWIIKGFNYYKNLKK